MGKERLEAFSDGVIAVIITIMVLDLKIPHGSELADLYPLLPVFFSYVLSYVIVGIYWNNHHHMLKAVEYVTGPILWANLHLLFWLSLVPFVTGWMGENHFSPLPVAVYGTVLLMSAVSYSLLALALLSKHGKNSLLAEALGRDFKGKVSLAIYAIAVPLAFVNQWISLSLYVLVGMIWFIPDRRIEQRVVKS